MNTLSTRLTFFFLVLLSTVVYFTFTGCDQGPPENSRAAQAQRGKVHYMEYCASCHGEDGTGVRLDSMLIQPADLTRIAASTKDNVFPLLTVARKIDGRDMAKRHGTRQMPIWGEVFSEEEYMDESQIKGKLGEIIAYLMKIQN